MKQTITMKDRNDLTIKEGQKASVSMYGHFLDVMIYKVEDKKVSFRTINPDVGQPLSGYFNKIEAERYLTITSNY
ncbi:hypothetical protein ACJRPK_13915 [Aquimarina sp. 2-A2]|uniref:hypothetical protein n=1 Tax=Aquimarina sp. 2-A2 TaxID=3382644 RepID=UPI00387EEEC0